MNNEKLGEVIFTILSIGVLLSVGYVVLKTQSDTINEANYRIINLCNITNSIINLSNIEAQIIGKFYNDTLPSVSYLNCENLLITRVIS